MSNYMTFTTLSVGKLKLKVAFVHNQVNACESMKYVHSPPKRCANALFIFMYCKNQKLKFDLISFHSGCFG